MGYAPFLFLFLVKPPTPIIYYNNEEGENNKKNLTAPESKEFVMDEILNVLKVCDLDKEITISSWCTMHQAEYELGKVHKKDLIERIIKCEDALFIPGIFWDE